MDYAIPPLTGRRRSPKKKNECLEEAMSKLQIKHERPVLSKAKKIKIECPEGKSWDTKVYLDGKDLLKILPGIHGIEFTDFVSDGLIELKLHLTGLPVEFNGKAKIIEIFGEESYCLIDRSYIEELKGKIKELRKENQELHKLIKK